MTTTTKTITGMLAGEGRIIVWPIERAEQKRGALVIAGSSRDVERGNVVCVGRGSPREEGGREPLLSRLGDTVLYVAKSGQPFHVDGEEFISLLEVDVIASIREEGR